MKSEKRKILNIILIATIICLLLVSLCACNLFQSVEEAEQDKGGTWTDFYIAFTVDCKTILQDNNMSKLNENLKKYVPKDGVIIDEQHVRLKTNDTAFSVLKRVAYEKNIQIDFLYSASYNSYYIKSINYIYEKSCGVSSGWLYFVNAESPIVGSSLCYLKDGDKLRFVYSCKYGDVG